MLSSFDDPEYDAKSLQEIDKYKRARRQSILNRKFLIATIDGDIEKVKDLIKEGIVKVNYKDNDGNTALHNAVRGGHKKLVKFLISMEDYEITCIERNNSNETPLDIATSLKLTKIVEILMYKIAEKSLKDIESSIKIQPQTSESLSTKNYASNEYEEKAKIKIKRCAELLEKQITEQKQGGKLKLTARHVNIFILFIEAMSLEDASYKWDNKTDFVKYIGSKNLEIFKKIRWIITHRGYKIYKFDQLLELFCNVKIQNSTECDYKLFFDNLLVFSTNVDCGIAKNEAVNQNLGFIKTLQDLEELIELIEKQKKASINHTPSEKLHETFKQLVKLAHDNENKIEELEKTTFNIIVNIIPLLELGKNSELNELRVLRGNILHNFHIHSDIGRLEDIRVCLSKLRSPLIIYCSAEGIKNVLSNIQPSKDSSAIKNDIEKESTKIINDISGNFESLEHEINDSLYILTKRIFHAKDDEDVRELVYCYLRYIICIDINELENEEISTSMVYDDYDSKNLPKYQKITNSERKKIFEKFWHLDSLKTSGGNTNEIEIEEHNLSKLLNDKFDIDKNIVKQLLECDFKNNDIFEDYEIKEIIKNLESINYAKIENNVSWRDVMHCYNLPSDQRAYSKIDDKISKFKEQNLNLFSVKLNNKIFFLKSSKLINNMIEIFYQSLNNYKVKSDIPDIFCNKVFLENLGQLLIQGNSKNGFDFKDKYYAHFLIKKLSHIKIMAPFVTWVITTTGNIDCIDNNDLTKVVKNLLSTAESVQLSELLKFKHNSVNMYKIIFDMLLDGTYNVKWIIDILQVKEHTLEIVKILSYDLKSTKNKMILKDILKLLSNRAHSLYEEGDENSASEILNISEDINTQLEFSFQKCKISSEDFKKENKLNTLQNTYNFAQIYNGKKQFNKAFDILNLIDLNELVHDEDNVTAILFLIKSEVAYTNFLLEKFDEAYSDFEDLYECIIKFSLNLNLMTKKGFKISEICNKVESSKKYQNLISFYPKLRFRLGLLSINLQMGNCLLRKGQEFSKMKDVEKFDEAIEALSNSLKMFKKLHNFCKNKFGHDNKFVLSINRLIGSCCIHIYWLYSKPPFKAKHPPGSLNIALYHCSKAMGCTFELYSIEKEWYGFSHRFVVKTQKCLLTILIALSYHFNEMFLKNKEECKIIEVFRRNLSEKSARKMHMDTIGYAKMEINILDRALKIYNSQHLEFVQFRPDLQKKRLNFAIKKINTEISNLFTKPHMFTIRYDEVYLNELLKILKNNLEVEVLESHNYQTNLLIVKIESILMSLNMQSPVIKFSSLIL